MTAQQMYLYCKLLSYAFKTFWCNLPEDNAETRSSYTIQRIPKCRSVRLLVITVFGMFNILV
jgi:hypothetical protein